MKWKQAIQDYNHYLKIERGLSENSIKNYLRDVEKLITYLSENDMAISPIFIDKETIQRFVY
ncbi:MAG: site-specific integrase, partial [Maribacter sp.]|nr:site-specific integrase [Maribacter sp.]